MIKHLIIAGVMKSSTTTLHQILKQSPSVTTNTKKELHYFDYLENPIYDEYLNFFDNNNAIMLDSSPSYIYLDGALKKIKETLPENSFKIIIILRNPVKRAFSHYLHYRRLGWEKRSFEEAIQSEIDSIDFINDKNVFPKSYLHKGFYSNQIKLLKKLYNPSEYRVYIYEHVINNYDQFIDNVCDFAGIEKFDYNLEIFGKARKLRFSIINSELIDKITIPKFIKNMMPYKLSLASRNIKRMIFYKKSDFILSGNTYKKLQELYKSDILKTERLFDINLNIWKQ